MERFKPVIVLLLPGSIAFAAPLFNAFNAGELGPLLKYRIELDKRQMGVEEMTNFLVKEQGAAFRRPGTEYIGEVNDSNEWARMIPFEYSTDDAYIIVINGNELAFYRTVGD